ncbi:MAG: Bacillibactin exporter [Candidatus Heimdallarchaeota archaeon LC_3]|nr:MAG: Bacillibactin exporter [Candidatus Heimdallarchaeota archaeon LC_3]
MRSLELQHKTQQQKLENPITIIVLLLVSTLTVMAGATLSPAIPEIEQVFINTPNVEVLVRLIITLPALFIALGAPIMGVIVDKWGRKKLLTITTVLYGFAGGSGFFLNSLNLILISRIFLGIAVAGIMITSTTLIADYYQESQRNKILGYQAGFMAFGGILFLITGGFLATINWQFTFLIYFSALFLIPGILIYLYEPESVEKRNISKGQKNISGSDRSVPYKFIITIYSLVLVLQIFFFFSITELPFFLAGSLSLNPNLVGIVLASMTVSGGVFSILYKSIKEKISFKSIFFISHFFFGLGYILIAFFPSVEFIVIGLFTAGIGLGLFVPNVTVWLTLKTHSSIRGRVLSGFTMSLFLGQFLSTFISQLFLNILSFSFSDMFLIAGISMIIIALVFLGLIIKEKNFKTIS